MNKNLCWSNILFFILTPIVAILATIYLIASRGVPWQTWVFSVVYMVVTGLCITAGYHRLFSHKCYRAAELLKGFYLLFGAGAFEGSVMEWCSDHRNHHRFVDQEKDPYSINKGFWHAHILWLFTQNSRHYNFINVQDLQAQPLIRWQHKYYVWVAIVMGFVFPMAICSLWHDPLGGLFIAGALRMSINHHATFAVNSVCHYFGKRTYSKISARDNWMTSLITYGEGFHNYHHQFPIDYRNGVKFYHYDPTKWLIIFFSTLGLARDLKRIDPEISRAYLNKQKNAYQLQSKSERADMASGS